MRRHEEVLVPDKVGNVVSGKISGEDVDPSVLDYSNALLPNGNPAHHDI